MQKVAELFGSREIQPDLKARFNQVLRPRDEMRGWGGGGFRASAGHMNFVELDVATGFEVAEGDQLVVDQGAELGLTSACCIGTA